MKPIKGADLFCGLGGTSLGFIRALKKLGLEVDMWAVNHWTLALAVHRMNHPFVHHKDSDLERVDPRELVPDGYLDFLWASPECTYYSVALGGKPVNNQSRATPKWVLKWLSNLDVRMFAIENVPEFRNWGPVHRTCNCARKAKTYREALAMLKEDDKEKRHEKKCHFQKPIKSRMGEYYYRFIRKLQSLGYHVEYRVLCAADYGAPTSRKRLFIAGSKVHSAIPWPEPTHSKDGANELFGKKKKWKSARDHVINPKIPMKSIFDQSAWKKPLSPKTIEKIMEGFRKFNGKAFMMGNQSGARPLAIDESPVPTLTASGHINLLQPYIIPYYNSGKGQKARAHSVDEPFPTVVGTNSHGLVQPFFIEYYGNGGAHSIDETVPTVTGNDRFGLVMPIVQDVNGNKYLVDIHYRMFHTEEYMAAQGLPRSYKLKGGVKAKRKMIGNAVPPAFAEAITYSMMKDLVKGEQYAH